jgi:hypothetical protein
MKCPCEECKKETPKKQFVSKHKPNLKLKSFKPIPKVSAKRKIENLKYSALRIEFLGKKENRICPITKQPTTEVHHTYCGKDRAKYYLDVSTWLAVSRKGHNWIHDNPKEARELGFLK